MSKIKIFQIDLRNQGWKCVWLGVAYLMITMTSSAVVLPVEVMGPPPHVETVTINVPAAEGIANAKLLVRAHNLSYEYKGRIRVNGNGWYLIWNDISQIKVAEPDRSYGGFGGGFSTVTFTMDAADIDLKVGDNTIEFDYFWKHPDHGTAGYRIVGLDVISATGESLLPEGSMTFDDPTSWEPPLSSVADIAAGKAIWNNANLDHKGLSCGHCHTDEGRDLKYFNVSNKVIIEQVKKEIDPAFTELQAQQVASYIRSLDQDVVPQARPWNPPYQPGPGTDSRPVYEWAAGAGLDAVLKSDEEMLPYLFGTATQEEIDAVTDIREDLNLREMPIAVQFPDWIHWLPRTHPMQIWGKTYWENEGGEAVPSWNNPHEAYQYVRYQFENNDLANSGDLVKVVNDNFQRNVLWWIGDARSGHPWTDLDGKNIDRAIARGYSAERAKLELSRWRAVKLWDLMHTYGAEDKTQDIIPTAETYQWPANYFSVFQIAAHFIGDDRGTSRFAWESEVVGTYFSSIWYQLQMILNPGMREPADVSPVDWAYNYYHINILGERTGVYEPIRMIQNLVKGYQQRDHHSDTDIAKNTWIIREVSPWRLFSDFNGDQTTFQTLDTYGYGALRLRVLRSQLTQFLRKSNEYSVSDWPRGMYEWEELEPASYMPKAIPYDYTDYMLFAKTGANDANEADAFYRLIPFLGDIGLERSLVEELVDWCEDFWPKGDWQGQITDPNLAPVADAGPNQYKIDNDGNGIEDVLLDGSGSYDPDGTIVAYEWKYDATVLSTAIKPLTSVPVGVYDFELTVTDNYGVTHNDTVTVTVDSLGGDSEPPTPNPLSFVSNLPTESTITMTAETATDPSGVSYFFQWRKGTDAWTNSGWVSEPTYMATGLDSDTEYTLFVVARDGELNMGSWSAPEKVTTDAEGGVDTVPPTPNPLSWKSTTPTASSITMTAETATDPSGVSYFFQWRKGTDAWTNSGWVPEPTYMATGLAAGTEYTLYVIARDGALNMGSWSSSAKVTTSFGGWTELSSSDFESGLGDWVSGGSDAFLNSDFSIGTQGLNIQDNSGDGSSAWLDDSLNLTGYSQLQVEFTYMPRSMEDNEDFWVQFSDDGGSSWTTVQTFVAGAGEDFENLSRENPVVTIDSGNYDFTTDVKIKFRCDASGNADDIFIDDVVISAQ